MTGEVVLRRALGAFLVLAVASTVIACGATPDEPEEQPSPDRASTPAERRQYSARELSAALPRGSHQLHGFAPESQCRRFNRACGKGADAGIVTIFATRHHDHVLFVVRRSFTEAYWRRVVRDLCARGKVDEHIRQLDDGDFSPGERGTAHRTATSRGTWRGFLCTKSIEYVFPSDYPLDHDEPRTGREHTLLLNNGLHYLQVQSSSLEITRNLAEEYLERLE